MSDTGLPELPEGYFWRVTDVQGLLNRLDVVEIRRKNWLGSSLVIREYIGFMATEGTVSETARRAMRAFRNLDFRNPLKGDYPPKVLK